MVPNAQSCLLHQSSSHPFSLSVQLDTGCSARHRALGKPTVSHTELGSRGFAHRYLSIHRACATGPHRAAEPTSPWHSAAKRAGGREWCGPATAAHRAGTGTAQRGQLNPPQPHKRGALLTLPGTGPLPSWPGRYLPGGPAPARRPVQFFSQQPDSQQSWKLVQPLENRKMLMTSTDMSHFLI